VSEQSDREIGLAAFYAVYLREVEGWSPDEAAVLVKERYPSVRIPELRKRQAEAPEKVLVQRATA
jgi:hypothetical protein